MDHMLLNLKSELEQLVIGIIGSFPNDEPTNIASGNWTFPGLSRKDIADFVQDAIADIGDFDLENLSPEVANELHDYIRRIQFIRGNTVPNLSGGVVHAVPVIYLTIDRLRTLLRRAKPDSEVDIANTLSKVRSLKGRIGALEARLRDLEPRSGQLNQMIEKIESGYQAAEQLPTDLMQLEEDRRRMAAICKDAENSAALAGTSAKNATKSEEQLDNILDGAESVLKKCESAYTAATSQGLAAAFAERSKSLDRSMWAWVGGMIVALTVGAYFGSVRMDELHDLVKNPDVGAGAALLNLLLAVLSVGGPIWLSWIATKQISQRFRLAEDYAFKAAVSRAYEGYRKEAARVDKELEAKLLLSALRDGLKTRKQL